MIAALYVETNGVYFGLPEVDPWDESRDARKYRGPYRVIAHPPCQRWGRYWSGGPSHAGRFKKGDDGGCFDAAIRAVHTYGGVIEHPEGSHAWSHFNLDKPRHGQGWIRTRDGWTCSVDQGNYGHAARKATWLYYVGKKPFDLEWNRAPSLKRLDDGFHSKEEAIAARSRHDYKPIERLTQRERLATPIPFRDMLLRLARE